eukprot:69637-Pleurochrysis_carterae.AAC.2
MVFEEAVDAAVCFLKAFQEQERVKTDCVDAAQSIRPLTQTLPPPVRRAVKCEPQALLGRQTPASLSLDTWRMDEETTRNYEKETACRAAAEKAPKEVVEKPCKEAAKKTHNVAADKARKEAAKALRMAHKEAADKAS